MNSFVFWVNRSGSLQSPNPNMYDMLPERVWKAAYNRIFRVPETVIRVNDRIRVGQIHIERGFTVHDCTVLGVAQLV